jgi:hypothetical protein
MSHVREAVRSLVEARLNEDDGDDDTYNTYKMKPGEEIRYKKHVIRYTTADGADYYTVFGPKSGRGNPLIGHHGSLRSAKDAISNKKS